MKNSGRRAFDFFFKRETPNFSENYTRFIDVEVTEYPSDRIQSRSGPVAPKSYSANRNEAPSYGVAIHENRSAVLSAATASTCIVERIETYAALPLEEIAGRVP